MDQRTGKITAVIFDFGEVLLETGTRHLYRTIFSSEEEMERFLSTVLTGQLRSFWNAGAYVQKEVEILASQHPAYREQIRAFYYRFIETVKGPVAGMPELLLELQDLGLRLYGLTNWGRDTFPFVLEKYRFLDVLDDVIVSGRVNMKKPNPEIFRLAIRQFNLTPECTLFTDDKPANIQAAENEGIIGARFVNALQLRDTLRKSGVPVR